MSVRRGVSVLCCAVGLMGCGATVPPGAVGVTTSWGRTQDWTYPEGFHFISPFAAVYPLSILTETYQMGESGAATTPHDEDVDALTRDQLAVGIGVSIQFHLRGSAAVSVFRLLGPEYATSVIHPIVRTAVRDAASSFAAMELVDEREAFQLRMESLVRNGVAGLLASREIDAGAIVVDNVLLLNIDLPDSLDEAIADVQRERQFTAQREQALRTAGAEAARLRTEAEGQAAALVIAAQAQADANQLVSASLNDDVLHLREIEASRALLESPNDHIMIVPAGQPLTLLASAPSTGR